MGNVIYYENVLYELGIKSYKRETNVKEEQMLRLLIRWDNELDNKIRGV